MMLVGFRQGVLEVEDYDEKFFVEGAKKGFEIGNLSGLVEGKIE